MSFLNMVCLTVAFANDNDDNDSGGQGRTSWGVGGVHDPPLLVRHLKALSESTQFKLCRLLPIRQIWLFFTKNASCGGMATFRV
jgi:hypothetical protein